MAWLEDREGLRLLDQTLLPENEVYLELRDHHQVSEAIRSLRVRGAPAIGVTAAMGLASAFAQVASTGPDPAAAFAEMETVLLNTRPTGRNLSWALGRMRDVFEESNGSAEALLDAADRILEQDREMCRRIGEHGLTVIPDAGARILTYCNAGALATAGIGTATAPIYLAYAEGRRLSVFAPETRPVLQGARLTAWELSRAGVDVTVITDSAVASVMDRGLVDLVIVGADAVAANGDVVNKIGTFAVAVLARHHGLPFYVAVPSSTLDASLETGRQVPIEERHEAEVRTMGARTTVAGGAKVQNPAFDVTPAHLVTAIITDQGVLRPPYGPEIARLSRD